MTKSEVFGNIKTFEQWDADYYPAAARPYYDRAIRQMLRCLDAKPGDLVLDGGCGPGEHSVRIAREGSQVHGIDISLEALEEAHRRVNVSGLGDSVTLTKEDLTSLSFPAESFDRVVAWGVVIHIPEAERALDELARILKPGGKLALYVTNAGAWDHALMALAHFVMRRRPPKLDMFPLGRGCWYDGRYGRLWVWKFEIKPLRRHLESLGLRQTHRLPGTFTEIQRRLRWPLRQLLLKMNNSWHWLKLPAGPCATNLLVFEKPVSAPRRS